MEEEQYGCTKCDYIGNHNDLINHVIATKMKHEVVKRNQTSKDPTIPEAKEHPEWDYDFTSVEKEIGECYVQIPPTIKDRWMDTWIYNRMLRAFTRYLDSQAQLHDQEMREARKVIVDDVMSLIDGHYDNPNLAGELEDYFGITFQEWNKQ